MIEPAFLTPADVYALFKGRVGRSASRRLVQGLGVQISPRRWIVARSVLERHLEGADADDPR